MSKHILIKNQSIFLFSDISESNNSFIRLTKNFKMYNYMKSKCIAWLRYYFLYICIIYIIYIYNIYYIYIYIYIYIWQHLRCCSSYFPMWRQNSFSITNYIWYLKLWQHYACQMYLPNSYRFSYHWSSIF